MTMLMQRRHRGGAGPGPGNGPYGAQQTALAWWERDTLAQTLSFGDTITTWADKLGSFDLTASGDAIKFDDGDIGGCALFNGDTGILANADFDAYIGVAKLSIVFVLFPPQSDGEGNTLPCTFLTTPSQGTVLGWKNSPKGLLAQIGGTDTDNIAESSGFSVASWQSYVMIYDPTLTGLVGVFELNNDFNFVTPAGTIPSTNATTPAESAGIQLSDGASTGLFRLAEIIPFANPLTLDDQATIAVGLSEKYSGVV